MPDIEFQANGGSAPGYLAAPESGKGPAWSCCRSGGALRITSGTSATASPARASLPWRPTSTAGETTDQPDEAQQKMMAMSMDQAEKDMRGAVDYLAEHEAYDGSGIGSVGFCLGGGLSVWAATVNPKVEARR